MAGINRLGKGTAKPGTLRPADPNRFKTEDFFSVDAEQDPEYLRRIVEVEQLAVNKTGSVLAKGAFDKNDALFMKDEAERQRHRELEQRDAELAHFSQLRSKLDQEAALEMFDAGPAPKRTKVTKPLAVVKRKGAPKERHKQPGETRGDSSAAQTSVKAPAGASTGHHRDTAAATGSGTAAAHIGAGNSMPGAEVAELVTAANVVGGQLEGGGAALPQFATVSAKSGCLGLQYDSEDDSEED